MNLQANQALSLKSVHFVFNCRGIDCINQMNGIYPTGEFTVSTECMESAMKHKFG